MEPELERRGDPEVRARAAQAPEELRVLVLARAHLPAVRGDEVDGEQAVDREPEGALQAAEPAAERQPGNAGVRHGADRAGERVLLRRVVELAEEALDRLARESGETVNLGIPDAGTVELLAQRFVTRKLFAVELIDTLRQS